MNSNSKKTFVPQSAQTKADTRSEENPSLHVQTGIQAGGFFQRWQDWWDGVSAGFNAFDRSSGAGG